MMLLCVVTYMVMLGHICNYSPQYTLKQLAMRNFDADHRFKCGQDQCASIQIDVESGLIQLSSTCTDVHSISESQTYFVCIT